MAVVVDSVTTDSENTTASNKTLTYSVACDTDDILVCVAVANIGAGPGSFGTPSTTSGSTSGWTQITSAISANQCAAGAWWAKVTSSGTIGVSQTTNGSGSNVGVRGALFELSGAHLTTPVGSLDVHDATTDPLASNSLLEIAGESGNAVILIGGDWTASTDTVDIDSSSDVGFTEVFTGATKLEGGEATYCCGYTVLTGDDATTRGVLNATGTGDWVAAIFEIVAGSAATNAAAGLATGTGTAHNAAASSAAPVLAGVATATGFAGGWEPLLTEDGVPVLDELGNPIYLEEVVSTAASVAPNAGLATAAGTAHQATGPGGAPATNAPAGVATATGTAHQSAPSVAPNAAAATATGTAYPAGISTTDQAPAGVATATGTAYNAAASTASMTNAPAGVAAATGTAHQPSVSVQPTAGGAAGSGTAHVATVSTSSEAAAVAGVATAAGTSHQPAASVKPTASVATGTGTAYQAVATKAKDATAGVATATGTGQGVTTQIRATTSTAVATGAAHNATASTSAFVTAAAGAATATGTAYGASVSAASNVTAAAGLATATGTAYGVDPAIGVHPTPATGTGTGHGVHEGTALPDPTPYRTTHYFAAVGLYELDAVTSHRLGEPANRTYDMEPV